MLTIVTALYCEAQPFLQYYQLKKDNSIRKFQVFQNDEMRLIITKPGSIAAAVGVSYLSTLYPPGPSDFLINIGICAAGKENVSKGSIFLCNKITEEDTGRSVYPDILFAHPFPESDIMTSAAIKSKSDLNNQAGNAFSLIDMEAAGIYQAAVYDYQPHQLAFLKVVSDYGMSEKLSPVMVTGLIESHMDLITSWLKQCSNIEAAEKPAFTDEEEQRINSLADQLHCSVTMEFMLRQQLHYYKLLHGSFSKLIGEFCLERKLPCNTKAEGKRYFDELKAKLV